jgi:hypothetical protein
MKTPPDDFEHDLQQLALRALPAHWKDEILASARLAPRRSFMPPRSLAFALAAAWVVIITLHMLTPATSPAPSQADRTLVFAPNNLFALHQHPDLLLP